MGLEHVSHKTLPFQSETSSYLSFVAFGGEKDSLPAFSHWPGIKPSSIAARVQCPAGCVRLADHLKKLKTIRGRPIAARNANLEPWAAPTGWKMEEGRTMVEGQNQPSPLTAWQVGCSW